MKLECVVFFALLFLSLSVEAVVDWPMAYHDLYHTGLVTATSSLPSSEFVVGWSFKVDKSIRASPVAADLDGDRKLEVVFPAGNTLCVLSHNGISLWNYTVGGTIRASATVGDLDGDNESEVVFGADDGVLYVLEGDGTLLWSFATNGSIAVSPALADLNEDGNLEVFFSSWDEHFYALDYDGRELWRYNMGEKSESSPALADINNDNKSEIVFGCNNNLLYALANPPYKLWMYQANGNVIASPAIGDLDGDGKVEIVFGAEDGVVYALRHAILNVGTRNEITKLEVVWNYSSDGSITAAAAVANLVNDASRLEVAVGSEDKSMYILNYNGSKLVRYTVSKQVRSTPVLVDVNGDSRLEVVFGADDKGLYIINHNGTTLWSFKTDGAIRTTPMVVDLHNNGVLEIVVGSDNGTLYMFESSAAHNKSVGDEMYEIAEQYYVSNDFNQAQRYALDSRMAYQTIGYSKGISEVNRLVDKIHAMEYCVMAEDAYSRNELEVAIKLAAESDKIYFGLNLGNASFCGSLLSKSNADLYYLEAEYFYENEQYNESFMYADEARKNYRRDNSATGLEKLEGLLNKTRVSKTASIYYDKALEYYKDGNYDLAVAYNKEALSFYSQTGHGRGLNKSLALMDRVNASLILVYADSYYNEGRFVEAHLLAVNARSLFERVGDMEGVNATFNLMRKTQEYAEAGEVLETAIQEYNQGNMENASYHASMALKICLKLNDTKCSDTAKTILSGGKKESGTVNVIYVIPVVLTVLLVVMAVVIHVLRRHND